MFIKSEKYQKIGEYSWGVFFVLFPLFMVGLCIYGIVSCLGNKGGIGYWLYPVVYLTIIIFVCRVSVPAIEMFFISTARKARLKEDFVFGEM